LILAKGVVFDKHESALCSLTGDEAIFAAIEEVDTPAHPGYPHDVVDQMTRTRLEEPDVRYPREGGAQV